MAVVRLGKWVNALRSGEYKQGKEALFDGEGYCCLGVADRVCFGAEFQREPDSSAWWDDKHNVGTLDDARTKALHLDMEIGEKEEAIITEYLERNKIPHSRHGDFDYMVGDSRQNVLISLNDGGCTFEQIADIIEACGWDKG